MGRVEEIGYVSVPFRLPASSTMGKSSSISYSSPYCHSKRRRTYSLPRGIDSSSASSSVRVAVEVVDIEPDRHRQTDPTDPVGVREDPRDTRSRRASRPTRRRWRRSPPRTPPRGRAGTPDTRCGSPSARRAGRRRPRPRGGTRREPCSSPCAGAVGEYDEVRADRVAGGEFDDVSGVVAFGRDSGVGVDAADRHARGTTAPASSARSRSQSSKRARWKV